MSAALSRPECVNTFFHTLQRELPEPEVSMCEKTSRLPFDRLQSVLRLRRGIMGVLWLSKKPTRISYGKYLGDNDRGCAGDVCEAPEGSGRMMQSKPGRNAGFDVIIRPEPSGASQTTPKLPSHDFHYSTKLANYRYFYWKFCCTGLTEPGVAAILFLEIYWTLSLPPYLNNCNRTDGPKLGT